MAAIEELFQKVDEISNNVGYWFVRTDSGENFDAFYNNDFIGLNWNEITVADITNNTEEEVKAKIARTYNYDLSLSKHKGKVTSIYTKLLRLKQMQKGDVVVIPSVGSERYAFGIVQDEKIFVENSITEGCDYRKRRLIKWVAKHRIEALDPVFYKIRMSRHAISSVKEYAPHIDKVMSSLFSKKDSVHFVIDIEKSGDINLNALLNFVTSLEKLAVDIDEHFGLHEDPAAKSSIKLRVQSKGAIELILEKGRTLVILSAVLAMSCGSEGNLDIQRSDKEELKKFIEEKVDTATIESIRHGLEELHVNKDRLTNNY